MISPERLTTLANRDKRSLRKSQKKGKSPGEKPAERKGMEKKRRWEETSKGHVLKENCCRHEPREKL